MTKTEQDKSTSPEAGGSIGFLRAMEKMQISSFEIPLIFLEDIGFSKDKIQTAKDFNRRFVGGFYARLGKVFGKKDHVADTPPKPARGTPATTGQKRPRSAKPGATAAMKKTKPGTATGKPRQKAPGKKTPPRKDASAEPGEGKRGP
jgi:hypothetical protein